MLKSKPSNSNIVVKRDNMSLPLWEYKICDSQVKITNKGSLFSERSGYWTLIIEDVEIGLEEGLAKLGRKGWELAGIQTIQTEDHRNSSHKNHPASYYIFKRPL